MMRKLVPKMFRRKTNSVKHVCDLIKGSESHLPRLPPNARILARIKRRFQKILLVSSSHPFTHIILRSKAAIAFEKRRHGISRNWWVIHPCSNFRFTWDTIMAFTLTYMFFLIPHMMAFHRFPKNKSDVIKETLQVLTPGYIICLIDIVLNFLTGYVSSEADEIFIDPLFILKHYAGKFFLIDLVSSVPYMWFYKKQLGIPEKDISLYLLFLEILPLLKLCRLYTLRYYVKEILTACGVSRIYEYGLWLCLLTVLIYHWSACLTYAFPLFYAYVRKADINEAEGYLFDKKLYNEPYWFIYLTSLHISGGNLFSYSFTEFQQITFPDKITRCILLLFGMAYLLYVTVIILQLVSSLSEPELKYQSIMHGVKDYIKNKKLPEKLKARLLDFYEHRFQGSLFKERAITATLSKHLKLEITQHSSKVLLESTQLFTNLSRNVFKNIIGALKQVIFLQGDIIYNCDVEGKCMYFIVTGTVAIVTWSGIELCHIKDGDYFGEIALMRADHKRVATAIALEVCEVLRLDLRDFNRLVLPKSDLYIRLELSAQQRLQEINELENEQTNNVENENNETYNHT